MADGHFISMWDGDLEEEDVWAVGKERSEDSSPKALRKASPSTWRLSAAPRLIPRASSVAGSKEPKVSEQSSAPLNIPDWSKIYRKNSKKGEAGAGSRVCQNEVHDHDDIIDVVVDGDVDGDGDSDDEEMVPPHECIARKLGRSQISSFSMCEGIGRTLKGRDLRKVRNAILTKTGFLE
ncbi:uncharacterized protein LOC127808664 [Diospyros lotus]|uniref:uncharacterized protein LOC127808664 n=1 Tax=Diospyros lotus TaxID=55363 RepID=UPI002252194F|nr:uncharacterized protein LOC127808664 [Diospyros lotus]